MNLKFNYRTLLYLFPALLIFIVFNVLPGMTSLILSFFEFSGFETNLFQKFVGWKNFIKISNDKYFWIALKNTFLFVFGAVFIQTGIALLLAIFIFFGNFKYSTLIRSIIFFPCVLAPVSVGLVWKKIFEQDGVLNTIIGLDFSWLSSVSLAIWLIITVNTWQWIGYTLVIYYAGLQSLNTELLEAADIDGANWRAKIFSIVIPLLWPTTILNMILNLIGGFRAFDIVYVLTRGGPAHYSEVLASYLYYYSFAAGGPSKMGVGASIAFVIFACIFSIAIIRVIAMKRINK
jgi:raffinose/stachyose/melibiose transport system permease protein